ncbi:MAG: barstar family protein [Anaerolineae bacterium]|nr:barstar family protein [Anaerolineae bacterium]
MSKLQRALRGTQPPGIYHFASGASVKFLKTEANRAGFNLYYLDGSKIRDKKSFLEKIAAAMSFPAYFGKNWDALNDMLADMSWAQPGGLIILWQSPERFRRDAPEDWEVALELFRTAVEFWSGANVPYYVLLRGRGLDEFPVL